MSTQASVESIKTQTTVRARVAFALGVAESILIELSSDDIGFSLGQEALELAWKWQEETTQVSGDILARYVDSSTEKDLGVRELYYEEQENMISAIVALTLAIGYTARQAYRLAGAKTMPTPIHEISDDSLEEIVQFASQTRSFDQELVKRLCLSLLEKHKVNNPNELGIPIKRDEILSLYR